MYENNARGCYYLKVGSCQRISFEFPESSKFEIEDEKTGCPYDWLSIVDASGPELLKELVELQPRLLFLLTPTRSSLSSNLTTLSARRASSFYGMLREVSSVQFYSDSIPLPLDYKFFVSFNPLLITVSYLLPLVKQLLIIFMSML